MLGMEVHIDGTIVTTGPIVVGFNLPVLGFGSEHDDDTNVLLPNNSPEVLTLH